MTTNVRINKPVLQLGSQGAAVKELQTLICEFLSEPRLQIDGIFGRITELTVKEIQERFFLVADGIVGQRTWTALITRKNENLPVLKRGSQGELVRRVQTRLAIHDYNIGSVDGIFGPKTEAAVKEFQGNHFLKADGVIESKTWVQLSLLYPYLSGI